MLHSRSIERESGGAETSSSHPPALPQGIPLTMQAVRPGAVGPGAVGPGVVGPGVVGSGVVGLRAAGGSWPETEAKQVQVCSAQPGVSWAYRVQRGVENNPQAN